ncbi:MAG: hypothetical protein HeimC3_20290 [Candidatus Heimdallarchaeota archaeon LC_3]|nr:MAG: hypothetical protein HeimC3_20290 [Candidatus Heimdallarchaeota archaeon LC_3]
MVVMNLKIENPKEYLLKCQICNYTLNIPFHCKKQMQVVEDNLICWKGPHKPCCNTNSVIDLPYHHDKLMTKVNKDEIFV